ncbi:murein biosynthesis integral membrane protein MurJ [Streptomyces sp. NPDC092296]|uniref:murein biosynthesis integral membrane protein MurJ n=1 Tax=Streptomyces sp. NPDC092296 TaxID=3366012 RepID=UPI003821BD36
MSAPRDDRAQGRGRGDGVPQGRPGAAAAPGQVPDPYLSDPYLEGTYGRDPYDQEGHPPPPYGQSPYAHTQTPYAQQQPYDQAAQPQEPYAPTPYAQDPYPGPGGPQPTAFQANAYPQEYQQGGYPADRYGTAPTPEQPQPAGSPWDSETTEYVGMDGLLGVAGQPPAPQPAQQQPPGELYAPNWYGEAGGDSNAENTGTMPLIAVEPPLDEELAEAAAAGAAPAKGKVAGLLGSSAVMAAGTLVSRATGFLRNMLMVAAIGATTMGDSYAAANTLPTLLYILVGGGALNAVFVPQLVRSMKNDEDGGVAYANRLLTLVICGLAGVVFVTVLGAPLLVRMVDNAAMSDPASAHATVALARYCLPTIFFMGVHVVMGQILNARGRFGAMMWTPVLNNVVVIFSFGMYIWVFGTFRHTQVGPATISPEGLRLLGVGTLLGLTVQALSMIPFLRDAGFRYRPRFDWRGHGLGHAARLARWTFLFVLANQAGFLVVTQLATSAGKAAEQAGFKGAAGLAAFLNAQQIWQLPQAVITVSVMSAVLPRISRAAADGDAGAVRDDISHGLRTSAVAIVPAAFLFLSLGPWMGSAVYGFNDVTQGHSIGVMLSAFALGLIPYSVQYVLLRGFYAYEDTRTPFTNTVWVAITNAVLAGLCYVVLPARWAVTGMAAAYGLASVVGVIVAVPKLKRRLGDLDGRRVGRMYTRLMLACVPSAAIGFGVAKALSHLASGWIGAVATLAVAIVVQLAAFVLIAKRLRIEELNALLGMVRGRLGR